MAKSHSERIGTIILNVVADQPTSGSMLLKWHDRAGREISAMIASELGTTVETRRKTLGLGQEELAELAQVSPRFIGALEHGKRTVRFDKVEDVLGALGLEIDVRVRRQ